MTYVTIDRFEGTQAVLEDDEERTFAVPRERLPAGAKPGDVLVDKWKRVFPLHHLVEAGWWNVENSVGKVEKSEALPFPVDPRGRWKRGELPVISRWEPGGISVETGRKTIAGR